MASIPGLFRRGSSYYLRIVLPLDHPLRTQYRNGRWVQSLGSCSHREAVLRGTIRRAEILAGYARTNEPTNSPRHAALPATAKPLHLREVYDRWASGMPRSADTLATCDRALKLFEKQTGNKDIQLLTKSDGEAFRTWLQTLPASSKTSRDRLIGLLSFFRKAPPNPGDSGPDKVQEARDQKGTY